MILPFCGEYSYASYDRGDSYGLFLIDKEGNRAEGPEAMLDANGDEPSYTEGYMALRDKKTELWGIMDMNAAKWSVSPVYDKAAIYGNIAVTEMGGVTAVVNATEPPWQAGTTPLPAKIIFCCSTPKRNR